MSIQDRIDELCWKIIDAKRSEATQDEIYRLYNELDYLQYESINH